MHHAILRTHQTLRRQAALRSKHPNIVRNNVKNKMLHILVAMVRDGECFREAT